jgi:RNA polymerase sigma-70 factor (ECF subfamily)
LDTKKNTNSLLADEQLLLQRTADGDRDAFSQIYSYYVPLLHKLLFPLTHENKQDTDEIIQDIFLKIWEKREILIAIQSFQAYAFRMGRNMLVSRYRKEKVKKRIFEEIGHQQSEGTAPLPADDILLIEYQAIVRETISRLSPRQREIFELRTEEDLSLKEIAVKLGITLSAVKKSLYAAIRFVRGRLRDRGGWPISLILFIFGNI